MRQAAFTAEKLLDEVIQRRGAALVEWEEINLRRLHPQSEDIHIYPINERTEEMVEKDHWYQWHICTDPRDPEVTLQLCERHPDGSLHCIAIAGDLYRLTLEHVNGCVFRDINILVESLESIMAPRSFLYYSCVDAGGTDTAYSVPITAWQNFLAFRSEEEGLKQEIETRLLYIALCNTSYTGPVPLERFRNITSGALKQMKSEMLNGRFYRRPDIEDALLNTEEGAQIELLRMSPVLARRGSPSNLDYYSIRRRTAHWQEGVPRGFSRQPAIDDLELGASYSPKSSVCPSRSSTRRARRSARLNAIQGNPFPPSGLVRKLPQSVQHLIAECFNSNSVENVQSRNLGQALVNAAKISPRGGNVPRSWLQRTEEGGRSSPSQNTSATSASSSRATTSPPGAEISAMEESLVNTSARSSVNRSELEAMGRSNIYVDDLSTLMDVHESTATNNDRGTQTIADFSLLSGIAHLAVNSGSQNDTSMEQQNESNDQLNVGIIPAGAESPTSDIEAEVSFPFEDSITLWLASRHNESQIVTINTSDSSANVSGLLFAIINAEDRDEGGEGPVVGVVEEANPRDRASVVNMSNTEGQPDPTLEEESESSFHTSCVTQEDEARFDKESSKED